MKTFVCTEIAPIQQTIIHIGRTLILLLYHLRVRASERARAHTLNRSACSLILTFKSIWSLVFVERIPFKARLTMHLHNTKCLLRLLSEYWCFVGFLLWFVENVRDDSYCRSFVCAQLFVCAFSRCSAENVSEILLWVCYWCAHNSQIEYLKTSTKMKCTLRNNLYTNLICRLISIYMLFNDCCKSNRKVGFALTPFYLIIVVNSSIRSHNQFVGLFFYSPPIG